jgi:hypothetical protein
MFLNSVMTKSYDATMRVSELDPKRAEASIPEGLHHSVVVLPGWQVAQPALPVGVNSRIVCHYKEGRVRQTVSLRFESKAMA